MRDQVGYARPPQSTRFRRSAAQTGNSKLTTGDFLNSLLIPCFGALESRKPAIHASFHEHEKRIPCFFPCYSTVETDSGADPTGGLPSECYGASISSILPSFLRWRTLTLP